MARFLVIGGLAGIAVLVGSAVIVATAPYLATVGVVVLVVYWYEKSLEKDNLPPSETKDVKVIDPK